MEKDHIIAYCHIGKVGGKQLHFYLRSHFGARFRGVAYAKGRLYTPEDLAFELKINPRIAYLGGHDVRPSIDFTPFNDRLQWFSFFREPKDRLISHYYQQKNKSQFPDISLLEWLDRYSTRSYWNIFMVAGENNLQKALDIVNKKFTFVGLTLRYEESLFLFAHHFQLQGFKFNDQKNKNPPENLRDLNKIKEDSEACRDILNHRLADEITFYQHVSELYKKQVDTYGQQKLQIDLNNYLTAEKPVKKLNLHNLTALAMDYAIWRPLTKIRAVSPFDKIRN